MNRFRLAALALLLAAGCNDSLPKYGDAPQPPAAPPVEPVKPAGSVGKDPQGPDAYHVRLDTTEGPVMIEVRRDWAPRGADRFYRLVKDGYFDGAKFFRVVPGFVAQFGMAADPATNAKWDQARIKDDPVRESNKEGYVTFATSGDDSRTTQVFINLTDNPQLDTYPGSFAPFGKVVEGMDAVKKLYSGYGESTEQSRIGAEGNAYLDKNFPELDAIKSAKVTKENGVPVSVTEAAPKPAGK